jgi:hypothetical protein
MRDFVIHVILSARLSFDGRIALEQMLRDLNCKLVKYAYEWMKIHLKVKPNESCLILH